MHVNQFSPDGYLRHPNIYQKHELNSQRFSHQRL